MIDREGQDVSAGQHWTEFPLESSKATWVAGRDLQQNMARAATVVTNGPTLVENITTIDRPHGRDFPASRDVLEVMRLMIHRHKWLIRRRGTGLG